MKKPKISIIIPNYNYGRYIDDALKSVLAQKFNDWECIVIDDASTDDSIKIIKKYIKKDSRFKLIQSKKHIGTSSSRNKGLDAAQGDYIAFLDSDDCYTDYALDMLYNLALSTKADMIGAQTTIVPENYSFVPNANASYPTTNISISNNPVEFLLLPKNYNWCWIWRRIYKRELLKDVRFLPDFETIGDDLTFMLNVCWRAKTIVETPNISVMHRYNRFSVMNKTFDIDKIDWFPKYFKYIKNNMLDKYDFVFLRYFYQNTLKYLLLETVAKPKIYNKLHLESRKILIDSCKYIPLRYLTFKQKILCKFLSWLK